MNTPEDPVDALLREQDDYLDDNGFTARVVRQLPRRRRGWLRPVVLLGAVAIGTVMAWYWLPLKNLPLVSFTNLFSPDFNTLLPLGTVVVVAAALGWGAFNALQREE